MMKPLVSPPNPSVAVIGGGPAGLRAAEVAASAGLRVTLYEAKPSVGRKFLVAGKGGLNITHGEALDRFQTRYSGPGQPFGFWPRLLGNFDPGALRQWAAGLGVETFQATTGRVYPVEMKAAPLLRRWVARLRGLGVTFEMNHRLVALKPWAGVSDQKGESEAVGGSGARASGFQLGFTHGATATADAVILALGGGSWPETGSDGGWAGLLESLGLTVHPLAPANCGWVEKHSGPRR